MSGFRNWTPEMVEAFNAKQAASKSARSRAQSPWPTETAASIIGAPTVKELRQQGCKMLEDEIQEQIEAWLRTQVHRAWWDRKRMDKPTTSRKGVPDFIGTFAGVAFGLEVKRPGEKPTTDQLGELAWMRKAGAQTAVVFSKDEAVEFFLSLAKSS